MNWQNNKWGPDGVLKIGHFSEHGDLLIVFIKAVFGSLCNLWTYCEYCKLLVYSTHKRETKCLLLSGRWRHTWYWLTNKLRIKMSQVKLTRLSVKTTTTTEWTNNTLPTRINHAGDLNVSPCRTLHSAFLPHWDCTVARLSYHIAFASQCSEKTDGSWSLPTRNKWER